MINIKDMTDMTYKTNMTYMTDLTGMAYMTGRTVLTKMIGMSNGTDIKKNDLHDIYDGSIDMVDMM